MKKTIAGKLTPHVVSKIWGGEKLFEMRALPSQYRDQKVGETWDVSLLSDGPSRYQGELLSHYLETEQMPYLIKTIDASEELSIQCHPGDEYAARVENSQGKTECWLVLSAGEGGGIYIGFKKGVTRESFFAALEAGDDVSKLLNFYPVKGGEFFFVPAGTIHAIGRNVTLAEVQQSSGITYRVWDWNRVDDKGVGRELHVAKARDVLNFKESENTREFFKYREGLLDYQENAPLKLVDHPQFEMTLKYFQKDEELSLSAKDGRALSVVMLKGEEIDYMMGEARGQIDRSGGHVFYDPSEQTSLNLRSRDESLAIIVR